MNPNCRYSPDKPNHLLLNRLNAVEKERGGELLDRRNMPRRPSIKKKVKPLTDDELGRTKKGMIRIVGTRLLVLLNV